MSVRGNAVFAILVAGLLTGVVAESSAAPASGACAPNATRFKLSDDDRVVTTTSSAYVPVGGTEISFVQGGGGGKCIVISFTAEARSEFPGVLADVAVFLDGNLCRPATFNTLQFDFVTTGLTAVCPDVAPGAHTVQIKFRRSNGNGFVKLRNHTTVVQYRQ